MCYILAKSRFLTFLCSWVEEFENFLVYPITPNYVLFVFLQLICEAFSVWGLKHSFSTADICGISSVNICQYVICCKMMTTF